MGTISALLSNVIFRYPRSWPIGLGIFAAVCGGAWIMVAVASSSPPDLIVTLKPDASESEINTIFERVLGVPSKTGKGYALLDSVSGISRADTDSNPRLLVSFDPRISDAERERIRSLLSASPLVINVVDTPSSPATPYGPRKFEGEFRFRKDKQK